MLPATVLGTIVCIAGPLSAWPQSVPGWKVDSPPNSVQLVKVDPPLSTGQSFTFKNVSSSAIIEFFITAPNGTIKGVDAFSAGRNAVEPDAMAAVTFNTSDFLVEAKINRSLRVVAVIFANGKRLGSRQTLESIEDQMLGAALEIKRDSDLLADRPDAAFDEIANRIGLPNPPSDEDAAASVRGVSLPGIPQAYIDLHVNRHSYALRVGVGRARQILLSDLNQAKLNTQAQVDSRQIQASALSDFALKCKAASDAQVKWIGAYKAVSDFQ
jgi:hypothetical protein